MTRRTRKWGKQLWEKLPEAVRKNEVKFRMVIEAGVGTIWRKEERSNSHGGPLYHLSS